MTDPATLTPEEIAALCPGYKRPGDMVKALRQQGFERARVQGGRIVLERPHFVAVCEGRYGPQQSVHNERPRVRPREAIA